MTIRNFGHFFLPGVNWEEKRTSIGGSCLCKCCEIDKLKGRRKEGLLKYPQNILALIWMRAYRGTPILTVLSVLSAGLGAIKRVRNLVPRETLITICKALVQPYFDYCSSVWGSIGVCQSERLQKLQNRAARLITFSDLNVRSSVLLGDLSWDCLEQRRSKQLAINLFKALHNLSPIRLTSIFKTTSSVHSHNLRNSKYNLFVPRPSTEAGKRSFQYRGSVLWNSLPLSAKTQPTLGSFKLSLCH